MCPTLSIVSSPEGTFVGQQIILQAKGCSLPPGDFWDWYNLPTGCTSENTSSLQCTPTGDGQFNVGVDMLSNLGGEAGQANVLVTVYSDLAITNPAPIVDAGESYNLSVLPTADTIGEQYPGVYYYYQWSGLPSGCTGVSGTDNGADIGEDWATCTDALVGNYTPELNVEYSNGESISNMAYVTIYPLPVPTLDAPTFPDKGQSFTMSVAVAGGAAPIEYQWWADGGSFGSYFSGCTSAILPSGSSSTPPWTADSSATCTASYTGDINTVVRVKDASGSTAETSNTYQFVVYQDPAVSLSASRTDLDVGQKVWFNSTASYGSGGYQYAYSNLPTGCQSSSTASLSCTPSGPGSPMVSVVVTDSDKMATPAATATVDVSADPEIAAFSAAPASGGIDVNQTTNFTVTVVDGYGSYAYSWSGLPTGCGTSNSAVLECTPTASGTFPVVVTVEDSNKYSVASSPLSFIVYRDPVTTTLQLSRQSIDDHQTVNITEAATAQAGGLSYTWDGLPSGCYSQNLAVIPCSPPSWTGTATVYVLVSDANGYKAKSPSVSFTVYPLPQAEPPLVVNRNTSTADVGQLVTFAEIDFYGGGSGSGGDRYLWTLSGGGIGCSPLTGIELNCTPTAGGNYNVTITVTDSNGGAASSTVAYTVYGDPNLTAPNSNPGTPDIGVRTKVLTTETEGSGGFTYLWSGLPAGCASSNSSTLSCTPSAVGRYLVTVAVTDSNGFQDSSPATAFIVNTDPTVTLGDNRSYASCTAAPCMDANQAILFYANATGGSGIYSYSYAGLPPGCNSQNTSTLSCTPTSIGVYTVNVTVTDSGGGKGYAVKVLTVYKDPIVTAWFWSGGEVAYANESLAFEVNYTNGLGSYKLCFLLHSAQPSGASSYCSPSVGNNTGFNYSGYHYSAPGSYPVTVSVLDSVGWNYTLRWNQTVYWLIQVSPPSVASTHEGVSTNATFSIYNLHGAIPLTWWLNDSTRGSTLCGPVTTSTYGLQQCTFVPTWNGANKFNLTVADSLHSRLFVTFTYTVVQDLGSLAISARAGSYSAVQNGTLEDEVGAAVTLTATYKGGLGPYTCKLSENGTGLIAVWNSSTASCSTDYSWYHGGKYLLTLSVVDVIGGVEGAASLAMTIDVDQPLTIVAIKSQLTTPDAGALDNLSAKLTGGLAAFSFAWGFGAGVNTTTTQSWVKHSWQEPGLYTVVLAVTDGAGVTAKQSVQIEVSQDPSAEGIAVFDGPISSGDIGTGGNITLPAGTQSYLNLTFGGGAGPYAVVWMLNGTTINSTVSVSAWDNISQQWETAGSYALEITVADSDGMNFTFSVEVDIVTDVVGPVTLGLASSEVDAGMWDNVTSASTGGWGPFTYVWAIHSATGNRIANDSTTQLQMIWSIPGSYTVTLTVVDAFGFEASGTATLTVVVDPTADCLPTLTAGAPMVEVPLTFSLTCWSGGISPYSYRWSFGNIVVVTSHPQVNVTLHMPQIYQISVKVTDSRGGTATSQTLSLGTIAPTILSGSYDEIYASQVSNQNTTEWQVELELALQTNDSDGVVSSYRIATNLTELATQSWVPLSEMVSNLTFFGSASQTVYVQVMDDYNRTSTPYELILNLTISRSPTGGNQGFGLVEASALVAVIGIAVLLLIMAMFIRRRKGGAKQRVDGPDPADNLAIAKSITDHLRENPNQEESSLIQGVAGETGARNETVAEQLAVLCVGKAVEKVETDGRVTYHVPGAEASAEELARPALISQTILATLTAEGAVTGMRFKEIFAPIDVKEGEIFPILLSLRKEGAVTWDENSGAIDFEGMTFRLVTPPNSAARESPDVTFDGSSSIKLPAFLTEDSPKKEVKRKRTRHDGRAS